MSFYDALGSTLDLAPLHFAHVALDAGCSTDLNFFELDEIEFISEAAWTPSPRFELHDHGTSIEPDKVDTASANCRNFVASTVQAHALGGYLHQHHATAQLYAHLQLTNAADKWALSRLAAIEYLVLGLDGRTSWYGGIFWEKHELKHNCLLRSLASAPHALDLLCTAFIVKDQVIAHVETVHVRHKIVLSYQATICIRYDMEAAKTVLSGNFFKRLKKLGVTPGGNSCTLIATITCRYLNSFEIHEVDLDADVAAL